jgi:hypothetical protein
VRKLSRGPTKSMGVVLSGKDAIDGTRLLSDGARAPGAVSALWLRLCALDGLANSDADGTAVKRRPGESQ